MREVGHWICQAPASKSAGNAFDTAADSLPERTAFPTSFAQIRQQQEQGFYSDETETVLSGGPNPSRRWSFAESLQTNPSPVSAYNHRVWVKPDRCHS
jgi:hypothetical protein